MRSPKTTTIQLPEELMNRIDQYLRSPVSLAKSKRKIFELSVTDFLDREEIINAKLEKEFLKVRQMVR